MGWSCHVPIEVDRRAEGNAHNDCGDGTMDHVSGYVTGGFLRRALILDDDERSEPVPAGLAQIQLTN
jgi:hypothetical protein